MALARRLANDFTPGVRSRGSSYFGLGRVRITRGSATEVDARVHGSHPYQVTIRLAEGELRSFCECPYFADAPCKHLWATILAADAQGYMRAIDRLPVLSSTFEPDEDEDHDPIFPASAAPRSSGTQWRYEIAEIERQRNRFRVQARSLPARAQILYGVDVPASQTAGSLVLELVSREFKKTGEGFTKAKELRLGRSQIADLPDPSDRQILSMLGGGKLHYPWTSFGDSDQVPHRMQLLPALAATLVPLMCATERCFLKFPDEVVRIAWDDGDPWSLQLDLQRQPSGNWAIAGVLRRGEEKMDVKEPALLVPGGLVFTRQAAARLDPEASFDWISRLRLSRSIEAPEADTDELMETLLEQPGAPPLAVPEQLNYASELVAPTPRLLIKAPRSSDRESARLQADLVFDYAGRTVSGESASRGIFDSKERRFIVRDRAAEAAAAELLNQLGMKFFEASYMRPKATWELHPKKLPLTVRKLAAVGWRVEADGKTFRRPGSQKLEVASGVDWFELRGDIAYGDTSASLPAVLEALRQGREMVALDDGTYGLLPEEWLARLAPLAALGAAQGDHLRFRKNQAGLLDALLAAQPEVRFDAAFQRLRKELQEFQSVQPAEQPEGFSGQLRDYQREGLGWMAFLRKFGFGGCLADDMGVGKTAQVLALLEDRRLPGGKGKKHRISLIVVPKSLVFNWQQEASRFTPGLRVLDYTGLARTTELFSTHDVVLTTYGTLRRDALLFQDIEFDYIVLDEAQAIKNASTESAKAARLLRGSHRLALSGTPVENHLGELWSLFEFLNPGMLGSASLFGLAGGASRNPDEATRRILAQTLRPFILRRTKEQVARELPPKTEQTIYCELEPPQRKIYNDLRTYYRGSLLRRIEENGLQKSKMHVLEALLRLRQAACHPGLLDETHRGDPSAKLEVLISRLAEVVAEGHKALVFSQFTSLLSIVRDRLDSLGLVYEYLDGKTRDRQARVERFQSDPACPLFLISLKAGGLGLNLTAAEYVFLLDPWWNPATEAQAVDRAHRIGQDRHVFAYRLIARDTVEEKVLELQSSKRDLAAAIITEANSLIRDLRREDLELLLS